MGLHPGLLWVLVEGLEAKSLIQSKSGIKTPSFSWMKKTKICLSLLIKVCSISICFDYKTAQPCKDPNLCPLGNRFLERHFHPQNSKYENIFILSRFSLLLVFSLPIMHLSDFSLKKRNKKLQIKMLSHDEISSSTCISDTKLVRIGEISLLPPL